jgi:hypothetical protein
MPTLYITDTNARDQVIEREARLRPQQPIPLPGCYGRRARRYGRPDLQPVTVHLPIIPPNDWKDLINQSEGKTLKDLRQTVLPPHDQGSTNYCWAHGVTRAVEIARVWQALPPLTLAAESIAVPITGGVNRGGSADEALEQFVLYGACEQRFWPNNSRREHDAQDGWKTNRLDNRVLAWLDVQTWEEQITLALHRIPVAIGLRWWGHLVCQVDAVITPDGQVGIGIDNSWGPDWGDNGYAVLDRKHGTADLGAFAPYSITFPEPYTLNRPRPDDLYMTLPHAP